MAFFLTLWLNSWNCLHTPQNQVFFLSIFFTPDLCTEGCSSCGRTSFLQWSLMVLDDFCCRFLGRRDHTFKGAWSWEESRVGRRCRLDCWVENLFFSWWCRRWLSCIWCSWPVERVCTDSRAAYLHLRRRWWLITWCTGDILDLGSFDRGAWCVGVLPYCRTGCRSCVREGLLFFFEERAEHGMVVNTCKNTIL